MGRVFVRLMVDESKDWMSSSTAEKHGKQSGAQCVIARHWGATGVELADVREPLLYPPPATPIRWGKYRDESRLHRSICARRVRYFHFA